MCLELEKGLEFFNISLIIHFIALVTYLTSILKNIVICISVKRKRTQSKLKDDQF